MSVGAFNTVFGVVVVGGVTGVGVAAAAWLAAAFLSLLFRYIPKPPAATAAIPIVAAWSFKNFPAVENMPGLLAPGDRVPKSANT